MVSTAYPVTQSSQRGDSVTPCPSVLLLLLSFIFTVHVRIQYKYELNSRTPHTAAAQPMQCQLWKFKGHLKNTYSQLKQGQYTLIHSEIKA